MKHTTKKSIIYTFATENVTESFRDNKIILITALGLLSCEAVDLELCNTSEDFNTMFYNKMLKKAEKMFVAASDEDSETIVNDGYLLVKNAVITCSGGVTYCVQNAVIFYDQIIGITYGNPATS